MSLKVASVRYTAADAPREFGRSLRETGFAVLVDPPISDDLLQAVRSEWLAFFGTDAKRAYVHRPDSQEGYFPPPDDAAGDVDRKEFFHVRRGGVYPREVTDAALRYFDEARSLGATLLRWLSNETPASALEHLAGPLHGTIEDSAGTLLRIQHYLPLPDGDAPGAERGRAHEDINLITLLPAPLEPGLQVLDRAGAWHDVPASRGSLIVNSGEMLQLLTGGLYPATRHRVLNPPPEYARRSRVSLPLFLHPRGEVELAEGQTAASFLAERVASLRERGWRVAPGGRSPA